MSEPTQEEVISIVSTLFDVSNVEVTLEHIKIKIDDVEFTKVPSIVNSAASLITDADESGALFIVVANSFITASCIAQSSFKIKGNGKAELGKERIQTIGSTSR